jgi:hypothetical protein
VAAQRGDIAPALAESGQPDASDIEAIVEVLAEAALGDVALEIAIMKRQRTV